MNNIKKIDNLYIINDNGLITCKKKLKYNIINKYNYLKSKNFKNIINFKLENNYIIRDYIEEIQISKEDKLNELVYVITMLHTKTTHFKDYLLNDIKTFYEKNTDEIIELKKYYNNICEENDYYLLLKPSVNLLIKNISLILISLDNSKFFLDKWYEIVKEKEKEL